MSNDIYVLGFGGMGMSMAYGNINDEESKEVLRHAIKIGCVSLLHFLLFPDEFLNDLDFHGYVSILCME